MHLSVKFKKLILSVKLYLKICKKNWHLNFNVNVNFFKKLILSVKFYLNLILINLIF